MVVVWCRSQVVFSISSIFTRCLEPQNSSRHIGTSTVTTSASWHSIKSIKRCLVDDRLQNHRRCVLQLKMPKCNLHFPFWRLQKLREKMPNRQKKSLASEFLLVNTESHWLTSNFCRLLAKRSWVCMRAFHQKGFASVSWFQANPLNVPSSLGGPEDPQKEDSAKSLQPRPSWKILKPLKCHGKLHFFNDSIQALGDLRLIVQLEKASNSCLSIESKNTKTSWNFCLNWGQNRPAPKLLCW